MLIKVKNWEHYNHAMGKYITSRAHYEKEMAKGNFIPFKESEKIVARARRDRDKPYKPSKEALDIMKSARATADKKGNVKLGSRAVDGMKKLGVSFDSQWCPSVYKPEGGF